ncbi:MAG: hypothetical protein QM771_16125 [Nitrospira sp.]
MGDIPYPWVKYKLLGNASKGMSEAAETVLSLRDKIVQLGGSLEAASGLGPTVRVPINRSLADQVPRLAEELHRTSDEQLDTTQQIIKYQSIAWGYIVAATAETGNKLRAEHAEHALEYIEQCAKLISLAMNESKDRKFANWIAGINAVDSLNHNKAIALAVKINAGQSKAIQEMIEALRLISEDYKVKFDPEHHPDIMLALKNRGALS